MENQIVIDVIKGGYVLCGPVDGLGTTYEREVFVSERKLIQKIKEMLEVVSTTPSDETKSD